MNVADHEALPARRVTPRRGPVDAVVIVPGSKSIANRALVCAALADGVSTLHNVPGGDDTAAMLDCVALLGAGVEATPDLATPSVTIVGTGSALRPGPITLPTRLAGTTSRFVTALVALGAGDHTIDGLAPLRARPMAPLHDALAALGANVRPAETWGHLPVSIGAIPRSGTGARAAVAVRGDVSSQYITALMLIAPYLDGGLRIELTSPLISQPYVAITAAVMASFGVTDVRILSGQESSSGAAVIEVDPGRYAGREYVIEPDASTAGYPLAAAAICGGRVTVPGLRADSLQGDAAFADLLGEMGCTVSRDDEGTTVVCEGVLRGLTVDMADLSDLVPTLAVVAPFANSATEISGVGFIRHKESDRLGDLATELARCGVRADVLDDGIRIHPGVGDGSQVGTHHDHRLAMAFGLLGLRVDGVAVEDPAVVSKSWPEYWTALDTLGGAS